MNWRDDHGRKFSVAHGCGNVTFEEWPCVRVSLSAFPNIISSSEISDVNAGAKSVERSTGPAGDEPARLEVILLLVYVPSPSEFLQDMQARRVGSA
jgi:hypothetical protein